MCGCKGKCRCDIKKHINIILIIVAIIISGIATALLYDGGDSDPPGWGGGDRRSKTIIDSEDNIHVFWLKASFIDYAKFNSDGRMIIEPKDLLNISEHRPLYFSWDVKIDGTDQIHILYNDYYVVTDTNGEIISEDTNATGITNSILNPIFSINDNQLIAFNKNQTIDSDNNIHTVMFTHYSEGTTDYNNLQYRKMSSNGTLLINKSISKDYWMGRNTLIADNDGNIHVFGLRPKSNAIFHAILDNDGNIIKDFTIINTDELIGSYYDIDIRDNNIGITYTGFYNDDRAGTGSKTFYLGLDLEGNIIIPAKKISNKPSVNPSITIDSLGNAIISYETTSYPFYIAKIKIDGEIEFTDIQVN